MGKTRAKRKRASVMDPHWTPYLGEVFGVDLLKQHMDIKETQAKRKRASVMDPHWTPYLGEVFGVDLLKQHMDIKETQFSEMTTTYDVINGINIQKEEEYTVEIPLGRKRTEKRRCRVIDIYKTYILVEYLTTGVRESFLKSQIVHGEVLFTDEEIEEIQRPWEKYR